MRRRYRSHYGRFTISDLTDAGCSVIIWGLLAVAVLALGLALFAVYLEATEPTSGTVTGLEFIPEHEESRCNLVGRVTVCHDETVEDCYEVTYDNGDRTGDACITKAEFDGLKIGDDFIGGEGHG